jgi:hypothetical protein
MGILRDMVNGIQPSEKKSPPAPTTEMPSLDELMELAMEGEGIATDGCEGIEPDGVCEHEHESWLRYLGGI